MKKFLALLMVLTMTFSLAACVSKEESSTDAAKTEETAEEAAEEEPA